MSVVFQWRLDNYGAISCCIFCLRDLHLELEIPRCDDDLADFRLCEVLGLPE